MNNNELKLDIGFATLVVGIGQDDNYPEVYIGLIDKADGGFQDIALARPHKTLEKAVECLVWNDEFDENYTHKFEIGLYEGE